MMVKEMYLNRYQRRIRHFWLYALKLEAGKYYVGITAQLPEARIRQHGGTYGARWTQKYKPVEVLEIQDLGKISNFEAEKIEQQMFEEYRKVYKLKNVRGGRITSTLPVYRVGKLYFTRPMLEALFLALFVMGAAVYLILHGL